MFDALARTPFGFAGAQFLLGLGEAATSPPRSKSVAEWFPWHEGALADDILNAGTNVGALATPIIVTLLTIDFGGKRRSLS